MKKIIQILIVFITVLGLVRCDIIDESERYIEMKRVPINKNILLMYFTDQRCVNCPEASILIKEMIQEYDGALISVSIHSYYGSFLPAMNLLTEQGTEYDAHFNKDKFHPIGSIDGQVAVRTEQWRANIRSRFEEFENTESPVGIELSTEYDPITGIYNIKSSITGYDDTNNLKLMLWVVESNIVSIQQTPNGVNRDYVHNHIFREAITDTWGNDISVEKGKIVETENPLVLNNEYDAKNVTIIGFIYNSNTYEVYQTTEIHLIN